MTEIEEVIELVNSISNRCEIFNMVFRQMTDEQRQTLLPTLLEDIYVDSQSIMDLYCIKTETIPHKSYPRGE